MSQSNSSFYLYVIWFLICAKVMRQPLAAWPEELHMKFDLPLRSCFKARHGRRLFWKIGKADSLGNMAWLAAWVDMRILHCMKQQQAWFAWPSAWRGRHLLAWLAEGDRHVMSHVSCERVYLFVTSSSSHLSENTISFLFYVTPCQSPAHLYPHSWNSSHHRTPRQSLISFA